MKVIKAISMSSNILDYSIRTQLLDKKSKQVFFWNNQIPLYIDSSGNLKRNSKTKIIEAIRTSFGIDLTRNIKCTSEDVAKEIKYLKDRVCDLKDNKHSSRNSNTDTSLEIYKDKLSVFLNRNTTYNKFQIRKQNFDYSNIKRLLASFLLVTGQVVFKDSGYEYISDSGVYLKILKTKSYDILNPFYQKIFKHTYRISSSGKNKSKSLTEKLSVQGNIFKMQETKYNLMYPKIMYDKIQNILPYVKEADATLILKSVYKYKKSLADEKKDKDTTFVKETMNSIVEGVSEYRNGNRKEAIKILKKSANTKFLKLFKSDIGSNIDVVLETLNQFYYPKEYVDKNFVSRYEHNKELACMKEENYKLTKELERVKAENVKLRKKTNKEL